MHKHWPDNSASDSQLSTTAITIAKTRRLTWLTDLHLNFVPRRWAEQLAEEVRATCSDAVLLGGDLADPPLLADLLTLFADALAEVPVLFVLGNHDFYHGSLVQVTHLARSLCAQRPNLH